jgi:hypothetical protein
LQWTAINYFLEEQTEPIGLCPASEDPCIYEFPELTENYPLPIQSGDVVKWIMNKDEITVDASSSVSNLKIALVREGVVVSGAEDIGTVIEVDGGAQYYCTATIPCVTEEGCNYQFVIYDDSFIPPINCGVYAGATLQDVIDDAIVLSQVIDCTLNDFL